MPRSDRPLRTRLLALAGLWEEWRDPEGRVVPTCTVLTTQANELVRPE